jgi:hypothetical protein
MYPVDGDRRSLRNVSNHLPDYSFFLLKMETVGASKTLITIYKTTRRHIRQNRNINRVLTAVRTSDLNIMVDSVKADRCEDVTQVCQAKSRRRF